MGLKKIFIPVIQYLGKRKQRRVFERPPVIISGCARSGTTMLLSLLSAHSSVWGIPRETGAFCQWAGTDEGGKGLLRPERIDRIYREILIHNIPSSKRRWCEKSPCSIRYLDKIFKYFDNKVKVIHIIRDGRDVMTSVYPKDEHTYWVSPERWVNDVKKGLEYADHPNVLTVKYEDIVKDQESSLRKILDFIDEEYEQRMDEWYKHTTKKNDVAWFGDLKKLHTNSIQKWKKEKHSKRVDEIMSKPEVTKLLKELNYD